MSLPHSNRLRITGSHVIVKLKTQLPRSRSSESHMDGDSLDRSHVRQNRQGKTTKSYYNKLGLEKIDCKGHDPAETTELSKINLA